MDLARGALTWLLEDLAGALFGFAVLAAIFVPLERVFTARATPRRPGELRLDLLFFALQSLLMLGVLLAAGRLLQSWLGPLAPAPVLSAVHRLPLLAQVVLAVVCGDLLTYWAHRLSHAVPVLWRFHAVHHSVETLDWLAAQREHPLDGLYSYSTLYGPAFLLGVEVDAVMPLFVFRGLCANFVHSDVRVTLGLFGLLFGDPVLHRWHHAKLDAWAAT